MRKTLGLFAVVIGALQGCASATPIPGGQYYIECDSFGMPICFQKANETCPHGYKILRQVDEATPTLLDPVYKRNITIQC